jgi:hypothetical protein
MMLRLTLVLLLAGTTLVAAQTTVLSALTDPLKTFAKDGKLLAGVTVPASSIIGKSARQTPLGLVEVQTATGPVLVNGNAVKLDHTVAAPVCEHIETHPTDERVLGVNGMAGKCP